MDWYESHIDRQIREAQERGEFDDLPGAGKPLPGYGESYDEDWWLKDLVRREQITGALPATLLVRRAVEDVRAEVAKLPDEARVRQFVAALNERVDRANRGHLDGPPVALSTVDMEETVRRWRADRAQLTPQDPRQSGRGPRAGEP